MDMQDSSMWKKISYHKSQFNKSHSLILLQSIHTFFNTHTDTHKRTFKIPIQQIGPS